MRLTNLIRERIVRRAVDTTFDKQRDALVKIEKALALKAYRTVFGEALLKKINAVPKNWFRADACLSFNIGGQRHVLRGDKELPVPYSKSCNLLGVLEGDIAEQVIAHADARKKLLDDRSAAHSQLSAMLESINTFNKLFELWPEGKPFYEEYATTDKRTGAVAIRFDDMNKMLGLKTDKAA